MDRELWVQALVTIGVGAIAGGITNAVAIWMLFHPYDSRGIGPFRIQGAIPKNKARLARSIGRTVGERLLTPEDLAQRLSAPAVRAAFDQAVARFLDELLERERGPLREQLDPELTAALDQAVAGLAPRVADGVASYARTPEFERLVVGWVERIRTEVEDRPLAATLTGTRRAALKGKVELWVERLAEGDELERTLRAFVDRQLETLSRDEQPLLDRLPPGIVGALELAITDYLPIALERLSALLADPDARGMVEGALRTAFDHSVRDLLLHERILARIMVTDRTIERLVDGFEQEGFDRFAESLAEPEMKAQVTRAVNDAVVNFLRLPLGERLRRFTPDRKRALADNLADWLVRVARDPATREAIARAVDRLLEAVERRTWGEVLGVVPPERLAHFAAELLAAERGRRWVQESVTHLAGALLARPVGRPSDWLGPETTGALRAALAEAAWVWLQEQIPRVVEQIRVPEMVEQKVLGFSTQRMEEIVRTVTQRELDLIVRLGYVLGGLVGVVAFGVNLLL
ncbi:MAG TPA: DUF445 family protein [Gemmatimonadales bacterium]|jgi:uncharacterized membrane protein YheB (UPF0754 family)|nr:DUF445 family protein [Gemmatimonadales bacterium]